MRAETTYKRLNPDTIHGDMIIIQTLYSSFDNEEINALEDSLKNHIGAGIVNEYKYEVKERENEHG